jgi:acetyltransferase
MSEPIRQDERGLRRRTASLEVFFRPKSVAVIGATERPGSIGRTVLQNLRSANSALPVYAVNPGRETILGHPAHSSISAIPEFVDLAVIVTPASTVPGVVRECGEKGVRGAVIISAGFRETGPAGLELEREAVDAAHAAGMRIIGPNCLGIMSPFAGLNATFAGSMAARGSVAFLSQSGALCTAVLDWSERELTGFSALFSVGSMLDVGWGDLIHYLGGHPETRSIVLYMETVGDARSFLSAAREVALQKPIIVIKSGRTGATAQAAASHTGNLTVADEVLDAAFKRVGVLRVNNISDVFYMLEVLGKQPRPAGPRLSILTNAGGPGVLAADSLILNGGALAGIPPPVQEELGSILPAHWSHVNPIDILGDADAERYGKALDAMAKNPDSDGLLVIMTPQGIPPAGIAEKVCAYATRTGKPILASWMGGRAIADGVLTLNRAGIPVFPYPDTAAKAFCYLWRYSDQLRSLYETPSLTTDDYYADQKYAADQVIGRVRSAGRTLLSEAESKKILAIYGIPVAQTTIAASEAEAVDAAARIGFPVAVKLHSRTVAHKSEVGGVKLDLTDESAIRSAYRDIEASIAGFEGVTVQPMIATRGSYELMIGCSTDAQFGPVLLFGSGGDLVEVYRDVALGLPPLNSTLARRMMEQTRIWKALHGIRGRAPVNTGALEDLMVRFSRLVIEQPWIKEIDINPLLASAAGFIALDARIVVHGQSISESELVRPAIRPYPVQYVRSWLTKGNVVVTIRPIRPEDERRMIAFHEGLSERTVYQRYFHYMKLETRVAHDRLARICFVDYDRQMALVAERTNPETGERDIVAVGRLVKLRRPGDAEFAIVVADEFQGHGLGVEIVSTLIEIAREERLERVIAEILAENIGMVRLCRKLGFSLRLRREEATMDAELKL